MQAGTTSSHKRGQTPHHDVHATYAQMTVRCIKSLTQLSGTDDVPASGDPALHLCISHIPPLRSKAKYISTHTPHCHATQLSLPSTDKIAVSSLNPTAMPHRSSQNMHVLACGLRVHALRDTYWYLLSCVYFYSESSNVQHTDRHLHRMYPCSIRSCNAGPMRPRSTTCDRLNVPELCKHVRYTS